jgi:hypothetical protein
VVAASRDHERHDEQESWPCGHEGMILRVRLAVYILTYSR